MSVTALFATAAHFRVRAETGTSALTLPLAIATATVLLVTFMFTTLIHKPASIAALLAVFALSIGLHYGWKQGHPRRPAQVQVGH